ncbi:polysaccharide biosynthesis tyrosine autokinase [Leptothoe spongobia]|uniref:Polysaccharide biosynthesis tyrosine autokinase n=1 Tax=Leptothoe spongobia TAU-MAC 1115 TaxID=1967444 RepID=A0A947GG69_9CYAN|nr:polysaccharide biosynthesis tyrosine autokinase [Leptothoe spongobia]MBT9314755.1 polysaccharide biosynthesis tyrosine autokinase [Leptothoe spongobia TAU-MAC 1115]
MRADTVPSSSTWIAPERFTPAEDEGGLNVGALFKTLQRKWWIIAGMTAVSMGLAAARVLTEKPIYNGTFEILVKAQSTETEVISNVPETITSQDQDAVNKDLLKILTGPAVLQPVIEGIKERYPNYCPATPANSESSDSLEFSYDPCYQILVSRLRVNQFGKGSDIIRVTLQDPDPQTVQVVLNLVSQAYLTYSLESKQADIRRAMEFVEQKLPDLTNKVESLQDELQSLRLDYNIIDPDSRGSQLSGQVNTFSKQQLDLEIELEQNRATYESLRGQLGAGQEQASSAALEANPRYQSLLNSLLQLDTQIAEASTLYLDGSPDMEILKEQRENLLVLLEEQGEQSQRDLLNQMRALEAREQSLNQTLQGLSSDVDELSGISREYVDIQRELGIATENLNQFLAKQAALEIDSAQREIPWEIVTPTTKPRAQSISLTQDLIIGGVLGLLLGSVLALLLDKSTGVLYLEKDIQRTMQLPILGKIPTPQTTIPTVLDPAKALQLANGDVKKGATDHGSSVIIDDPFMEAFRSLYTNLRLSSSDQPLKSVVVSSIMDKEGKSVAAIHLAEAAALLGQRVLLVDTNLRDPKIHSYLKLPNDAGLTDLALSDANELTKSTFLHEPIDGLKVLCAGTKGHDAGHILTTKRVQKLIQQLKPRFDLVVFDSPSLLGQSDAYLVAEQVDGMLIVARPGQLKQNLLDQAMDQLRIANVNVFGVAIRES